jgi:hypothetical protein
MENKRNQNSTYYLKITNGGKILSEVMELAKDKNKNGFKIITLLKGIGFEIDMLELSKLHLREDSRGFIYVWLSNKLSNSNKESKRNHRQIYITVVTSELTMLANKVARQLQDGETELDACNELAYDIAKENNIKPQDVLVTYFNEYSDLHPVTGYKVPLKPIDAIGNPSIRTKQFKEFNSELFEAYINKFSKEDKQKAFDVLLKICAKEKYSI